MIEKEIRSTFEPKSNIDAVFISHLHEDHVNGLEFLIKHCNIRRLFLPFITQEEKIQLIIHNTIMSKTRYKFLINLITNPVETISKLDPEVRVYLVPPINDNRENNQLLLTEFENLTLTKENMLPENIKLTFNRDISWTFIPFNFQNSERANQLNKALVKANVILNSVQDLEQAWKNKQQQELITEAYKSIRGDFNTNSMTVYSGPEFGYDFATYYFNNRYRFIPCSMFWPSLDSGCLYLGDYDAKGKTKWEQLYQRYNIYWDSIGCVQIPHHGSSHNYNRKINQQKELISIISCGYTNKYRHPHSSTIKDIIIDGGTPVIVNEHPGSAITFRIDNV